MNDAQAHRPMIGRLTRRGFLRRIALTGVTLAAVDALLAACGGSSNTAPSAAATTAAATKAPATTGGSAPAAASTSAGVASFKGQKLTVTSYGGTWQDFMNSSHIPDFEAQTGAKVELAIGLSKDWFAKIRAAGKGDAPYDVVVMNETYCAQLRVEGFFGPLPQDKVPNIKDVPQALRLQNDVGVLGLVGPLVIAYRTDQVKDPPQSWLDLGKYGGKTGIYTISNSAEPQHILMVSKILGGDPKNWQVGFDWIAKNLCNAKQVDFSGTIQTQLTQGEVTVGILDTPTGALMKKQGVPVEFIIPKEGAMGMFEQNMNVMVGSKQKELAYAFINYWLSEPVQRKWAESFYYTPANPNVVIGGDLAKLVPVSTKNIDVIPRWDYVWLNSGPRDQMTDKWTRTMTGHC